MYQRERENEILKIVKKQGYVTVKYLVEQLHYSNASINRDLNSLQKQKLIHRTYGGVEFLETKGHGALPFRYHREHAAKRKIAKAAAELVHDGDCIFIDGTTTTQFIVEFLSDKKDVTVISNNIAVITHASELGLQAICLGGKVVESPCMLLSTETIENAMKYHADKAFFSTAYIFPDGKIGDGGLSSLMHRMMMQNSQETYFLVDAEKFEKRYETRECCMQLSDLTGVITNHVISKEWKEQFPRVKFIEV